MIERFLAMTLGGQEPSVAERLLDQLDEAEAPPQETGDDVALHILLGKNPDEPKKPTCMESVRGSLEVLLADTPPEVGKAALEALNAEFVEDADSDRSRWTAGSDLMQVLGAAEPLSTLELERQIDAAAEAERAAERQLEQQQQNRAMLVALLQGLLDGEEERRLLDERDPSVAKRRRKRDRRRARAVELLKLYGTESPPDDLSADELSHAVAWLYEGEARPDQRAALEQVMSSSATDKLLARIDEFGDIVGSSEPNEWSESGAVGELLAAEDSSLDEGITQDMVHRILTQDFGQGFSSGRQGEAGWHRVVGDSDALWSDSQPPAQMPSAYANSLQMLGVLPLPGDTRADNRSGIDDVECDPTTAGDDDVLRSLGIAEPDQPEPKLPRGARNLNDLLGGESNLLKLLAEPFDVRAIRQQLQLL